MYSHNPKFCLFVWFPVCANRKHVEIYSYRPRAAARSACAIRLLKSCAAERRGGAARRAVSVSVSARSCPRVRTTRGCAGNCAQHSIGSQSDVFGGKVLYAYPVGVSSRSSSVMALALASVAAADQGSTYPFEAASWRVIQAHDAPFSRAHRSTSRWPCFAASAHVLSSHGQPFSRAHLTTIRRFQTQK